MKFERLIGRLSIAFSLAVSGLFAPAVALADFPPIIEFPNTGFYQARFLRDKHDVAVMELTGNYGRDTADGKPNVEPRTVVAKEFYRTHPDHYDFIVVFSNFEFDTKDALAFHMGVQNKVKGLGKPEFDNTSMFGSSGKLLGYIDMAALSRYVTNPYDTKFDLVLQVFAHEFLHQWGANVRVRAPDGSLSTALLGKDDAHWSFLLNSGASVGYGNQWRDNGDGTFTSVAGRQFYSPLDLYLMGLYRKEEVPPFFLIENPDIDKTRLPLNDVTLTGVRNNLSVDDVIAAEGPRVPHADHAQKEFRLGFVLLSRAGAEPTDEQIAAVNNIRKAIGTRIAVLTGGRALAHSYIEAKASGAGDPVVDPRSGEVRAGGANLADGMTWLRGKQAADGYWKDNAFTAVRDTVVAFDTLADLDGAAFIGRQRALDWLSTQGSSNTDYLARRLRALSRAGIDQVDEAPRLLAMQNSDGGWGVAPGYQSNPLDTALVMQALRPFEATIAKDKLDGAAAFLAARQNADGGWGNLVGGASRTAVSATVLQVLNGRTAPADLPSKAVAFLAGRQNADGGFGDSPSTVHDTANVVLALLAQNALGNIRAGDATSYVSSTQHTDGSWDGSAYATALALRLLKSSGMFNWALTDLKAAPDSPLDGQQAILSFKVSNNGTTAAPAGIVRVHDGDPAAAGAQIGQDIHVPTLPVGDSVELKLLWSTFEKAGSHNIFAIVDPENTAQEASKGDNRAQLKVVVRDAPAPIELLINVTDITVNPARPSKLPSVFAISALVSNIGKTDASAVRIVLLEGEGPTAKIIDEKMLNLLGRTQQVVNFSATLSRAGATKYTIAIDPDGLVVEQDKNNNVASVTVETSAALDLEVREADATIVRTPVYSGSDAVFKVKIRNAGTQDSPPFKVRYSVSNDVETVEVATRILQLAGGGAADQEVVWRTEFAGDLTFKVELDPDGILSESDKANNTVTMPFKAVQATGANLAVSFKDFGINPSPALESKELTLTQVVRNTGNVAASDIEVAFYDGDPAAGRVIGAMQQIAALAPGESATVTVTWPRYPDAEDHLIFFAVDPAIKQAEITRDDNAAFVVASALSMADLAISSGDMVVLPQSPKPGEAIDVSVKISNLGKQATSNVVVRAFDGDPAQGGKQVGADQIVASLAGLSSQTLAFILPASDTSANRPIVVVVDPDNAIEEKSKDNNIARRDLVVQDGDFYVTNRFFSPNGDGVKDDTTLGFRLKSATDVTVEVLNRRGKIIRSYGGDTLKNIQSGSLGWDGLNQRGSVVQDGDYRFRVLGKDGATLGEAAVSLDTNRSSILDAVDTPFEQFTNLSCELNEVRWPHSLKLTADEERVYLFNSQSWNGGQNFPVTLFREAANGADLTALLPADMLALGGWSQYFSMSLNGEKLALVRYYLAANGGGYRDQLWVMDGDGRNMKMVRDLPAGSFQNIDTSGILTGDGSGFVVRVGQQLQKIPTDGVSAETVLMDTDDVGGSIGEIQFSPDRNLALVKINFGGPSVDYLLDVRTGLRRKMPDDLAQQVHFQIRRWAPNSTLLAMGGLLSDSQNGGADSSDARFYVFDEQFNIVKTFQTKIGGQAEGYSHGVAGSLTWAGTSSEFVFSHSFCDGGCAGGEGGPMFKGPGAAVAPIPGDPLDGGAQHVLMRADLITGELEAIETTRVPAHFNESLSIPSTYLWAPNERTVLRLRSDDCDKWSGDSCIDAIALDDENKIRPLFRNWHGAPDVVAHADTADIRVQGFLPSGRKLMFESPRAALDPASSCYQTVPDQYTFGTLLNMTADLRPLRSATVGGLILRGTAADQNFARYVIEYAPVATPNDWKTVMPASDVPVVDNVFTNWVPPAYGTYFLRLSVEDQAGNRRQQIRRISWSDTPSITDVYKDIEFISPNGDAVQDAMQLHYRVLEPVHLEFNVYGKDNVLFRSVARDHFSIGQEAFFAWDGRDDRGRPAPNGQYRITVQNYEFYVTVDNLLPSADLFLRNAYGFTENADGEQFVAYVPALSWETDDINYVKMAIDGGRGAAPAEWLEIGRYPSIAKTGALPLTPEQFVGMQYRIKATDKAGNQTSAGTSLGDQQVFLLNYANHRRNNPPKNNDWLSAQSAPYGEAQAIEYLPRLEAIAGGNPVRWQFAETVRKPLAKVILQFKELADAEYALPLSSLDTMNWNEVLISDFVKFDGLKNDYVSVGNRAPDHFFDLLWDMQGIKAQTEYMVRVKVVDEDNSEFVAMSPHLFHIENVLGIQDVDDQRNRSLTVNAQVVWSEPVAKIDLLVSSTDDPRFATERSIHTVLEPVGNYRHYLGAELLQELDLRPCNHYQIRLKGTLASGLPIHSEKQPVPTRCLGADWIVAPDTAQSCNAVPTSKINVKLTPYAKDGRKLTQLLFGQLSDDGREDILNNWNDVQHDREYSFMLDAANVADGTKQYFVRVVNEDGKKETVAIPIPIAHKAPTAHITSPVGGQKICGIKARDPRDLGKLLNVVPIEATIASDSNVSYGLEYGNGANPVEWNTFSPKGVDIVRSGFHGLRQDVSRLDVSPTPFPCAYPDSRLCFDFHPIQWSSERLRKTENFPGDAAKSGELGRLGLLEEIEGEVSVRLRVFNAAGHQTCTPAVTFDFDNKVRVQTSSIDRRLFSPKADQPLDHVTLRISPEETVTVDVQVFPATYDAFGKLIVGDTAIRSVAQGQVVLPGESGYEWDGNADGNVPAADGLYVLRVTHTDGCGNQLSHEHPVELDATAPAVVLNTPVPDAKIGLIVPVIGSIRDSHFQSFAIQYSLPSSPDTWVPLIDGDRQTPAEASEQELANWNTLGLAGPATLRVVALDIVGNKAVVAVSVDITTRTDLISYLESVPDTFSPNGDKKRDTVSIRYGLLNPAKATLDILRGGPDGVVVKTLMKDELVSAGASIKGWDGINSNGQVEQDGLLVAKLTVTSVGDAIFKQDASTQFTLDNTTPKVAIHYPKADFVTPKGAVTLSATDLHLDTYKAYFAANPPGGGWQLVADGMAEQSAGFVTSLEGLAEGKYGVKVVAVDKAENATEVIKLFEVDNTPPKVALTVPLAGSYLSTKKGPVNIAGAVEERNLAGYSLRYGQGAPSFNFAELAGGNGLPLPAILKAWDIAQVADGVYTLWLNADDLAGQNGQARVDVVIDNTPPTAVIVLPATGSYVKQATDITGTAADDNFNEYKLEIAPGNKATANRWSVLASGAAAVNGGVLLKWQALPPDGAQTLKLTVIDKAGNGSEAFSEVVVDTQAPAAPLNLAAKLENGKDARLTWTANGESDLVGYAVFRNGARINQNPLTDTSYLDAALANGDYVYTVKAIDKAGWESAASSSASIMVSLTGPTAQIFSPGRGSLVSSLLDIKGTANAASDFKEYRLYIGAGASPTAWQLLRRSPVPTVADILGNLNTLGIPENSVQTLKLEAEDIAGAIATDTVTISVDNTPPAAATQLKATANGADVTLSWTPSSSADLAGYVLFRDERVANAQGVVVGSLKPYLIVPANYLDLKVADGIHTYVVQAMDKAENMSDPSNSATVTLDTRAPHATIVKPLAGAKIGRSTYLLATAPDTDIATVQFQYKPAAGGAWTDLGAAVTTLPYAATWDAAGLAHGDYLVQAVATDKTSHTDPAPTPIKLTYSDLQAPDVVIDLTGKVAGENVTLTWSSSATDLAGYLLERVDPHGNVVSTNVAPDPAVTFFDVELQEGRYTYRVYAIDNDNNKNLPSDDLSVLIYTPTVVQPYTPTRNAAFTLAGQGHAGAKISLTTTDDNEVATTIEFDPAADGSFVKADLPLALRDNWYQLTQIDAAGNISKAAGFHVRRADPPAMPTGLKTIKNGSDITLSWNANNEADLLGYRVMHNGQDDAKPAEEATATASSYGTGNGQDDAVPELAIDGNDATGWMPDTTQEAKDQWLQLEYPVALTFSKLKLVWGTGGVVKDYDIEAWDGDVWVPVAAIRDNSATLVETTLDLPYRTNVVRVKLVDTRGVLPILAEMQPFSLPQQADASLTVTGQTGEQTFTVYAENNYGMFSEPAILTEQAGDATPPDLAVAADDVTVSPATPAAGSLTRVTAVLKNIGGAAALNFEAAITVTDAQGKAALLVNKAIALLGAGGSYALAADWTPPNAGEYSISVTVDVAGSVEESGETNNTALRMISVAAPALPIELQVTAPEAGDTLLLNWKTPVAGNPVAYRIKRALTAGGPYELVTDSAPDIGYLDSGLSNGVKYFYVVAALGADGGIVAISLETWGIPLDKLAPAVPLILGPTTGGKPIAVSHPLADIVGRAEPGSNVALLRNNAILDLSVASTRVISKDFAIRNNSSAFHVTDDGRRLLSAGDVMELIEIDTGVATVVPDVADVRAAKWSRDGQSIAFIKYDSDTGNDMLYIYNDDDKTTARASDLIVPRNIVAWSHDGAKIAVAGFDSNGKNGLWLVDRISKENRLLVEAPWWQFDDSIAWSPDGQHLAFVRNGIVRVVKAGDGSAVFTHNSDGIFPYSYSGSPSWSFDGTRLIYHFYGTSYNYQIGEFSLQSGTARALSDAAVHRYAPRWIGPGNDYVDYENGSAVLRGYDGAYKERLVYGYDHNRSFTTPSGYLVYRPDQNVVRRVAPTGTFRFLQTRLNAGANDFSVHATDSANNRSASSESIRVTLANVVQPDLAAGDNDIVVLPSAPLVGELTRLTATVRNAGAATAKNFDVAVTAKDPHGVTTTLANRTIAELAAGESSVIAIDWTPAQAGLYAIVLSLDSDASVVESNEANNVGVRNINVAAGALPTVSVTTDAKVYSANAALAGNVKVTNAGPQFSGTVTVRVEDKEGYLVESLPTVSVTELAFGQSAEYPAVWNTGTVLAGDYRLAAQLRDTKGDSVSTGSAAFSIGAAREVNAAVVVDRTQYKNQQNATIGGTVELVSANANLTDATGLIQVVNDTGNVVYESSQALGALLPGASALVSAVWNTGNSPAGPYRARMAVHLGGVAIAVAETNFEVVTEIVAQLSGNLSLSAAAVANGDRLTASYVLQNTGNVALAALPVIVNVVDPGNQAIVATIGGSADLPLGGSMQGQAAFDVANWPLQLLQAVLSVELGGKTIVLQRATLRVIDRVPPLVVFVSPMPATMLSGIETPIIVKTTDRDSHVASVEYAIGGSPWKPFALQNLSEGLYNVKLAGIEDGPRQVLARATDAFGNISEIATLDVMIDNTPPLIAVAGVTDGSRYTSDVTPLVTVSDINLKSSLLTLDGLAFASGTAVSSGGAHALQIDAEDKAGNKSSKTIKFVIGKPPVATVLAPANGALVRPPFTLIGSGSSLTSSIAKLEYQVDGAAWADMQAAPAAAGQYQVSIGNLVDGAHKAALRATDADGLVSGVALLDFTVDGTPPVIAITGVTDGATHAADVAAIISVTDANLKSSTASLNGQAYASGATIHAEGSYDLIVHAEDKAGNTAASSRKFSIDRTPPVVAPGAPVVNSLVRELKTVQATAADALSAIAQIEYRIDAGAFKPMGLQAGTPNLYADSVAVALTDGLHTVAFRATDAAGNVSAPIEVPFGIDASPPVITVTGVVNGGTYTAPVTPVIAVADAHTVTTTILLDGATFASNQPVSKTGAHQLVISASDELGNKADTTVNFTINAKLTGSLAAAPKPVPLGDVVALTAMVANQGPALAGVQYQVTITDAANTVVQQFNDSGDLAANGTFQKTFNWITAGAVSAAFNATLTAKAGADNSAELGSDTFTLSESRVKLTGTVSVAPKEVEVGANALVTQQVINGGTGIAGVKVELTVRNAKTNAVAFEHTDTIDLTAKATWTADHNWKVTGAEGASYIAKLVATAGGKSFALGESEFTAIAPHPRLNISYGPAYPQRILILSQCKRSANANLGHCGAKPIQIDDAGKLAKCDDDRARAVDRYLTSLGISHKIVTNESDFARELKRGGYSGYWVSGGGTKLRQPLQTELKAGLRLGEALLADGLHDVRESDKALKELLSIHYRGKFPSGKAPKLTMLDELYRAGEFQVLGDVLVIDTLAGGKMQAEFRGSRHHDDDDDHDGDHDDDDDRNDDDKDDDGTCPGDQSSVANHAGSASGRDDDHACYADERGDRGASSSSQMQAGIVSGVHGPGRTLFFAFDWVDTVTVQSTEPHWTEIGRDSFNWLQPVAVDAIGPMIAGDIVTRKSRLHNLGQDVVLTITAELPAGAKALMADPTAQIQTQAGGDIVTWQLNLAAGEERDLNLQLRLPAQEGNYSARYTVKSVSGGKATLYGTDTVPLPVAGLTTLTSKAKDAIGALAASAGKNAAAKADALRWIGRAERSSTAKNDAQALRDLVMAQSRLDSMSGINLTAAQRALARMIRAVERRI